MALKKLFTAMSYWWILLSNAVMASSSSQFSSSALLVSNITESIYNFSLAILQDCNTPKYNFVVSPILTQNILALAYTSATGKTADVIAANLDLNELTQQEIAIFYNNLLSSIVQNNYETELNFASKIYINDNFQISPAFQTDAAQFNTEVETIDLSDSINATNSINSWVNQQTQGKIEQIVNYDEINDVSSMYMFNAFQFHTEWKYSFPLSHIVSFYPSETTVQRITMMNIMINLDIANYMDFLDARALLIPFYDPTLSMLFILPNQRAGLADIIIKLKTIPLKQIFDQMYSFPVNVIIPKFTITSNIKFNHALELMGMGVLFENADFGGMITSNSYSESLELASVIQKASITVKNNGQYSSFPSQSNYVPPSGNPGQDLFVADHPFLYMILKDSDVLLIGTFIRGDGVVVTINKSQTSREKPSSSSIVLSNITSSSPFFIP